MQVWILVCGYTAWDCQAFLLGFCTLHMVQGVDWWLPDPCLFLVHVSNTCLPTWSCAYLYVVLPSLFFKAYPKTARCHIFIVSNNSERMPDHYYYYNRKSIFFDTNISIFTAVWFVADLKKKITSKNKFWKILTVICGFIQLLTVDKKLNKRCDRVVFSCVLNTLYWITLEFKCLLTAYVNQ